jgi:hypothetical protein
MPIKKIDNWAISLVYEYGRLRERLYQTDLEDTERRDTILERIDRVEILLQDNYGLTIPKELNLKN